MRFTATFLKQAQFTDLGTITLPFQMTTHSKDHPNYEKKFNFLLSMWYAIMHNLFVYLLTDMIGLQAAP